MLVWSKPLSRSLLSKIGFSADQSIWNQEPKEICYKKNSFAVWFDPYGIRFFCSGKTGRASRGLFAEDNGRFVQYTLRTLSNWAAKNQWPSDIDVVHWNNGLWNCLHLISANISCADGEAAGESIKPENTESKGQRLECHHMFLKGCRGRRIECLYISKL